MNIYKNDIPNSEKNYITLFWIGVAVIIGLMVGSLLGAFAAGLYYFNLNPPIGHKAALGAISSSDLIAVANTYIVFISIIFILFTIGVTIGGYFFAKAFTAEKLREIHQNIVIIASKLKNDEDTRDVFLDELLKEGPFADKIIERLAEVADHILREKCEEYENGGTEELEEVISALIKNKRKE